MDALEFIAERSDSDTALAWYTGLEGVFDSLREFPLRCPLAREHGRFPDIELRQLIYKSHRIILAIQKREVHILHVRHVAQNTLDSL